IEILGPVKEYEDLNDSSVVLKVTFGNKKFLFTGDIEKTAEQDLIDSGVNLSADFLKIAHHGSSTSTSTKFLKKVNPSFAAISVNFDNKYSHPHIETIRRLELANVKYYLTRNYSVLIFKSDGNNITINNINN
ncbi:MAG: MBL fold metallo-hydrolase, partial [Oscillospiraceae bacterium]